MVRPLVPFIVRNFSLYWRNNLVDWAPLPALRDLRRVIQVMDVTSKRIFAEKKAILEGRAEPEGPGSLRSRMKGKDIMSIMRESNVSILYGHGDDVMSVRANMSSSDTDRLTDEELLGQMK